MEQRVDRRGSSRAVGGVGPGSEPWISRESRCLARRDPWITVHQRADHLVAGFRPEGT